MPAVPTVLQQIETDTALAQIRVLAQTHMKLDAAHDFGHCVRVAEWTLRIAGPAVDSRLCIVAALLHDVVNVPKDHPDRERASAQSAEIAASLLANVFEPHNVSDVCAAIRDHSYSRGVVPETLLGKALQDADRLDALGVIGMFRCVATGTQLGAALVDHTDPWAVARPLDDKRFCLDHVFTKLVRLPDTFRTVAGRAEANRRIQSMHRLLRDLSSELSTPAPLGNDEFDMSRSSA